MTTPSPTAIVTGASRGFGRAIAIALSTTGADVIGVARDADALAELEQQLGASFTPVVADVTDPTLAARLLTEHRPQILVLNAGASPHAASLQDQTWETFSRNWEVDVRHVFGFVQAALRAPLPAGSTVISMSSGAARMGSPLSGGYAGAKATIQFVSAYARAESERLGLGIRFVSVLPQLTEATALGSTFVDAYAEYANVDRDTFLQQRGPGLTVDDVSTALVQLVTNGDHSSAAYLLTTTGLAALG